MCRSSGLGCMVMPWAPKDSMSRAEAIRSGMLPPLELRRVANLLMMTLKEVIKFHLPGAKIRNGHAFCHLKLLFCTQSECHVHTRSNNIQYPCFRAWGNPRGGHGVLQGDHPFPCRGDRGRALFGSPVRKRPGLFRGGQED